MVEMLDARSAQEFLGVARLSLGLEMGLTHEGVNLPQRCH